GAFTGTLPAVLLIAGVWALAAFKPQTAAPYMGMLRLVTSSFLPVYGGAFAVSGIALILFKVVPMFLGHGAAPAPAFREPVPVAAAAPPRYQPSYSQPDIYPQSPYSPSAESYPQTNAYPPNPQQQGYQQDYPYPQQRYPFAQEPEYPQQPPRPSNRGGAPNPWSSPDSPTMP
ncbi:MAG: hypothetical protein ACXVCX_10330, partial [Ktedonobacterales bacterium]